MIDKDFRSKRTDGSYCRSPVNDTLLNIVDIVKCLDMLDESIKQIIGEYSKEDGDQGIWLRFRDARPGRRLTRLDFLLSGIEAWKDSEFPTARPELPSIYDKIRVDAEAVARAKKDLELEYDRLEYLLEDLCDVHWYRLKTVQTKLEKQKQQMETLRDLVTNLSQTRATLYANQLGNHIKYLTWVSVVFIPLGFILGLWSISFDIFSEQSFVVAILATAAATLVLLAYLIWRFTNISLERKKKSDPNNDDPERYQR
ncbi:Hypothetical protein D9617_9g026300 [Elsinoe fawcettii]|nr:Hypothetical protein D9617_9g026300 [Elsinoe fawcettii]